MIFISSDVHIYKYRCVSSLNPDRCTLRTCRFWNTKKSSISSSECEHFAFVHFCLLLLRVQLFFCTFRNIKTKLLLSSCRLKRITSWTDGLRMKDRLSIDRVWVFIHWHDNRHLISPLNGFRYLPMSRKTHILPTELTPYPKCPLRMPSYSYWYFYYVCLMIHLFVIFP